MRALISSGGERGLLSMAFSPEYQTDHRFYVSYTDMQGDSRVASYRSENGVGVRSTGHVILALKQPYSNHNGGQLQFDKRGYLYIGFGDGGSEDDPNQTSQNLGTRLGKLLRSTTTTPDVYRGPVSADDGRYFYGDYCAGTIWSFKVGTNGRAGAARVEGHVVDLVVRGRQRGKSVRRLAVG